MAETGSAAQTPDIDLQLPAEACNRLPYGRLDNAHTPATVTGTGLHDLRNILPGR